MPKSYYVVVFFMLLAIIFLLIYIVSTISWIKSKVKHIDAYIEENHYRFIRIYESAQGNSINLEKLACLKNSLDAKENFIEGLNYGKYEEVKE